MQSKFTYGDIVKIKLTSLKRSREGAQAWIVGVFDTEEMKGGYFDQFDQGIVYTIEFEDGSSIEIHEKELERYDEN